MYRIKYTPLRLVSSLTIKTAPILAEPLERIGGPFKPTDKMGLLHFAAFIAFAAACHGGYFK